MLARRFASRLRLVDVAALFDFTTACFHSSSIWHSSVSKATAGSKEAEATCSNKSSQPNGVQGPWLVRRCPPSLLPYAQLMRLDKPVGAWLLAWPCFWSIALAAPAGSLPGGRLLALFGVGALLLRGAGCTVNDLWDRQLDAQVERTRSRPLAAGVLQPSSAMGLLAGQLLAGLAILVQLNPYTQALGVASLALVVVYPLMKRYTFWPQAFLGLTFNWGALMGWSAVAGSCDWAAVVPLYASGVCWTLVYDTIYAHQDKRDDALVGIKSTALLFGERTGHWLTGFACCQTALLVGAGLATGAGPVYYAGVGAGACHLAWQISQVDLDSREDCLAKFTSNTWFGGILFSGIVLDKLSVAW
ncbi:hypothetical protein WJX72_003516 [[Myrmecia] bisecta]|uniref:4-hydroxybenzoate polyprenyltransferase, mitochondrial n=1 Tax=[Myrmecia] bisecta TaxID=41462 RepID=A0AAW1PAA1_9CHLO